MLGKALNRVLAGMAVLAGLLLLFMTFSIGYSIFARLIGIQSPVWTVQFNEYSLLWMTFLGTAWVLSRRKHVSMDIITGRLRPPARRITDILHSLMGIAVCGVLLWYSSTMTWNFLKRGVTDVQAVDVPKHLILAVIPIGLFLLCIQFLRNLLTALPGAEARKGVGGAESAPDPSTGRDPEQETPDGRKV